MRIGLYDPHLATLGGGERYFLSILDEAVRLPGASVTLLSPERVERSRFHRLGINLDDAVFGWSRARDADVTTASRHLDLLVVLTNDVPPLSHARRSVAVIQFPHRSHTGPRGQVLRALGVSRARPALRSYRRIVCYSEFAREHIQARLGVKAAVVPPPVEPAALTTTVKEPVILSVGRFFSDWHSKNQEVLVEAFAELEPPGWSLVLAGGGDDHAYVERVRRAARGLRVEVRLDVPRDELLDLYARAGLFWHAAGYGQDERRHPERLEHFGITTVEAMAHGAVPLVYAAGGPAEVVEDGATGRWWRTPAELVERTAELIGKERERDRLAVAAQAASERYSPDRFRAAIHELVLGA